MNRQFRHKKTGNIYLVQGLIVNATNAQNGQKMVLYTRADIASDHYARELTEFNERFESINGDQLVLNDED